MVQPEAAPRIAAQIHRLFICHGYYNIQSFARQLTEGTICAKDLQIKMRPADETTGRILLKKGYCNLPSADWKSKIGDMRGDFRVILLAKSLPYTSERPGGPLAARPVR